MSKTLAALSGMLLFSCFHSLPAQAQTSCSNASLSGTYFYMLSGALVGEGSSQPYTELGKLVADGNGGVTGHSTASIKGSVAAHSLTGSYSVQGDCTGTLALSVNSQSPETITFQVVEGGQGAVVAFSSSGEVASGRAYRAASGDAGQCGDTSFTGSYGFLLAGVEYTQNGTLAYSNAGQLTANGSGVINFIGVANLGTGASQSSGTGTYSIASDCSGTAQVTGQTGTFNYIVAIAEGGNVLLMENDSGTTVAGTAQAQLIQSILPQLAFGGGWYSAIYFTNTTNAAQSFPVTFTADNGTPLTVPSLGGTSTTVNIPALGTTILEAPNTGSLSQGYATFTLPPGVSGYGIFRQSVTGRADQEAVVPFTTANGVSSILVWDDTTYITAVAIANAGPIAATISITLRDNNGNVVGTSSVNLQPYQKTEATLRSLPGLSGMVGLRGRARLGATSGNVAVLGLRFNGSAFTSIPTTQP